VPNHELPDPVAPTSGAEVVDFPWAAVSGAIAELDAAATELANQLSSRSLLHATLVDWEGRYREDFDETYESLVTRAEGIVETLGSVAGAVVGGAEDAVADQTSANQVAEREAAEREARAQAEAEAEAAAAAPPAGLRVGGPGRGFVS
jgi:uncharacterized protein YukE